MKEVLAVILFLGTLSSSFAQKSCESNSYQEQLLRNHPALRASVAAVEDHIARQEDGPRTEGNTIIRIPVVVHVLYHTPDQKISPAVVQQQIDVLNQCFRRRHADTVNTPSRFRSRAADCEIEFQLASSDPRRRSTNGIVYKYTPVKRWKNDDKMKFSAEMGSDAWDSRSYLNIWVCNMEFIAGYASFPGGPAATDGVVIGFQAFGQGGSDGLNMGKTAVHEVAHWLGLRHIWGDNYCGDDGVADTPKQAGYNIGCPTTIRSTCGNGPDGDMFMNYMDLTSDACMNLFTLGQKARMQSLFAAGGPRQSILQSKGLLLPLIQEAPLPAADPRWLEAKLYPNPATTELILDLNYDPRWMGKNIFVTNLQGQLVMNLTVTSLTPRFDIQKLQPGVYFLAAKKDDGESMKLKFVKL